MTLDVPVKQPLAANNLDDILLFEQKIPVSMKKEFDRIGLNGKWTRDEKMMGLFYFYKSVEYDRFVN